MSESGSDEGSSYKMPDEAKDFIDVFINYDREIINQKATIDALFEKIVSTEGRYQVFDQLGEEIGTILQAEIEDFDDRADVINAFFTLILNYGTGPYQYLEDNSKNTELKQFITELRANHGIEFERKANRYAKGDEWWSNIKTDHAVRSGQPILKNEIYIDYEDTVKFSSDLDGGLLVAQHFIQQINQAPGTIGEDSLEYLNKDILSNIEDELVDLNEKIENYEEKHDIDINNVHPSEEVDEIDE